jgi:putative acetyltransferase
MGAVYRPAIRKDASRLYDIRRRSILALAPPTMPAAEAQAWAERLTLAAMERKLRELEVWVAEWDGVVGGWGASRGGYLEGFIPLRNLPGRVLAQGYWNCSSG